MGNTLRGFLITFFNLVLWVVVFINFFGWSGSFIQVLGGDYESAWSNSYFGFTSFLNLINVFKGISNASNFKLTDFYRLLSETCDTLTFQIPSNIQALANGTWDLTNLLKFLGDLLIQPIILLVRLAIIIVYIIAFALQFIYVLFYALGGNFNVQFSPSMPEPYNIAQLRFCIPVPVL